LNESLPSRIFISYRRQETAWPVRQLYDVLVEHFPADQVFKDVDNIDPGDDFVERITAAVGSCDVLLALIGPQWLTITNKKGQRRLDDPEDYVRLEIETALTRNIRVIPILVDEAPMPTADELPPTMAPLVRRQAVEINPHTFDTKRLIATVHKTLAELKVSDTATGSASQTSTANPPWQPLSILTLKHLPAPRADMIGLRLALSPDGRMVATGAGSKVSLWSTDQGQRIRDLHLSVRRLPSGRRREVIALAFTADGQRIAVGTRSDIDIFGTSSGQAEGTIVASWIWTLEYSPNGAELAVVRGAFSPFRLELYDAATFTVRHSFDTRGDAALSPDGRLLLAINFDGGADLWDTRTGQIQRQLSSKIPPNGLAFSADGRWLLAGTWSSEPQIFDIETDELLWTVGKVADSQTYTGGAFSPDGRWLVLRSVNGTLEFYSLSDRQLRHHIPESSLKSPKFSRDGRWLAFVRDPNQVELWLLVDS
jgi:WD40 repeat protein